MEYEFTVGVSIVITQEVINVTTRHNIFITTTPHLVILMMKWVFIFSLFEFQRDSFFFGMVNALECLLNRLVVLTTRILINYSCHYSFLQLSS